MEGKSLGCYYQNMISHKQLKVHFHAQGIAICKRLKEAGYEAYFVGGCVRDALLGIQSNDIDITTNARPADIHRCFPNAKDTGKAYGTVSVLSDAPELYTDIQITTYRSDGEYSNQRHPDSIQFEQCIDKDLSRRDFTVNALAYDPISKELIDRYSGIQDLNNKCLKTVGNAKTRFKEDSLRLLRLCRFSAQLSFDVDDTTKAAFIELSALSAMPAKERIQTELEKLMQSKAPSKGLLLIKQAAFAKLLLPGLTGLDDSDIAQLDQYEHKLRWPALIKQLKQRDVFHALNFSNKQERQIKAFIQHDLDPVKANFTVKDLAISGKDLQGMGYSGKQIGDIQKKLLAYVLKDLSRNSKEHLSNLI